MSNQSNSSSVRVYNIKHKNNKQNEEKIYNSTTHQNVNIVNNNNVVVNQSSPTPYVRTNFYVNRSSAFSTTCQHCQKKVMTRSIQTFNWCTCIFCCCTGIIIYFIIQIIRGKDICCYDAEHRCPNCKQTIAEYESC